MLGGKPISHQYSCILCQWAIYQPPVILQVLPLGHLSATSTLAHYATGRYISHRYFCTLCHWATYQPPVLLHFMPLCDLLATSTRAHYATGRSISRQYSCTLCHWAIYQSPVLLHIMALGDLSAIIFHDISTTIISLHSALFLFAKYLHTSLILQVMGL